MQLITPTKPLLAGLMLLAATQAHAKLASYTANGKDVVYSSVSNVTWTKDANLLGTMFASQGFDKVVNAIIAASPTVTNTPNNYSPTGKLNLSINDFNKSGAITWFGAMAYVNYLNKINYAGSNQWQLPTLTTLTIGITQGNGITKGNEFSELFYQELNGTATRSIPNTAIFDNETAWGYWSGTEYAPNPTGAGYFSTGYGGQGFDYKRDQLLLAWVISPGQIAAVPEPESVAMLLLGLGLVGSVVRRRLG